MLECAHMHIQCFEIPPKSTNPALVHLQTRDGLQNLKAPPKLFKTPPRLHVEDYDVDVRNIRNGVVDITNNVVVKCCK